MNRLKDLKELLNWFLNQFPDSGLIAMAVMAFGFGILLFLHFLGSKEATPGSPVRAQAPAAVVHHHHHHYYYPSNNGQYTEHYVRSRFGEPDRPASGHDYSFASGQAVAY
ncbi:MAG: hypothetical protein IPM23_19205 [Candidatus Melainabacteria bacterium]|nr:hypothetical protein [Candidatus Melainabacteria bacterium]